MRNPIRLKNLSLRFLPYYAVGLAILVFYPVRPEGLVLGLPFVVLGAAIRSWGAGHLVKNDELTISGPYAHLRHPLYFGTLAVATGFVLMIGGWLGLALLAIVWPWFAIQYFPRKEKSESARLEAIYGEAFRAYRSAVPALWPRLRPWVPSEEILGTPGVADARSAPNEKNSLDAPSRADARAAMRWDLARYSDNNELGTLLALVAGAIVFSLRAAIGFR